MLEGSVELVDRDAPQDSFAQAFSARRISPAIARKCLFSGKEKHCVWGLGWVLRGLGYAFPALRKFCMLGLGSSS